VVPPVVVKCVAFVEQHGLDLEGIYRISGGASSLRDLRTMFNQNDVVRTPPTSHTLLLLLSPF
jgi:hypothetical protein